MDDQIRLLVAGWIGSTNLGDELVLAGLHRTLDRLGVAATAISVDPAATAAAHGIDAVGAGPVPVARAAGRHQGLVLGGGGLLQDETSPFNLPYHLSRAVIARARGRPVAGVGLGAGPLTTVLGRRLVPGVLRRAVAVSVRDEGSAAVLREVGGPDPVVAADLAFALPLPAAPLPEVEGSDRLVVCLRPWTGTRSRLPVGMRRSAATPEWFLAGMATALEEAASRTGLRVHFVAFQRDRDPEVHHDVARRMRTEATFSEPDVHGVVAEVAAARAVVAMRYHAGVSAVLGGLPAVLVGYSPKVPSLSADLGPGAASLGWAPGQIARLPHALESVLGHEDAVAEARDALRRREVGNEVVLERLLEAISR